MPQPKPDAVPATEETHPLELELSLVKVRVSKAAKQIQASAEAAFALAHGLEARPMKQLGQVHPEQATRLAHELLLAVGFNRRDVTRHEQSTRVHNA